MSRKLSARARVCVRACGHMCVCVFAYPPRRDDLPVLVDPRHNFVIEVVVFGGVVHGGVEERQLRHVFPATDKDPGQESTRSSVPENSNFVLWCESVLNSNSKFLDNSGDLNAFFSSGRWLAVCATHHVSGTRRRNSEPRLHVEQTNT